jgi:hypothetical protein
MCEEFLNQTDDKYKTILLSDDKYPTLLKLSVESGAKKITEYFLNNNKFRNLLSDPIIAEELLYACLSSKEGDNLGLPIANMLLSEDINLSKFNNENNSVVYHIFNSYSFDIVQKSYNSEVIKQIKRKLLYEELKTEFNEEIPKSTFKRMKI